MGAWTLQEPWLLHLLLPLFPPPSFSISFCAGLSGRPIQLLGSIFFIFFFFPGWTSVLREFIVQLNGWHGKLRGWVQSQGQLGWQCHKLLFLAWRLCDIEPQFKVSILCRMKVGCPTKPMGRDECPWGKWLSTWIRCLPYKGVSKTRTN